MNEKYDLCDIDESYLHTVSMTELFDSAYQSKPPIIDTRQSPPATDRAAR